MELSRESVRAAIPNTCVSPDRTLIAAILASTNRPTDLKTHISEANSEAL